MQRTATAQWNGDLKSGKGQISTESGVMDKTPYSFQTRFESQKGTNPEELIAAAHAGCFTMALAHELAGANMPPEQLETSARVSLDKAGEGWAIGAVHLVTRAKVPGAEQAAFQSLAEKAKTNCPVSKLLNAKITLEAMLDA